MAPILYMTPGSPPVRTVLMVAKALGISFNEKQVNLVAGENKSPEYLKINPQHTIPVLVEEDGFTLCDSHAIITYLVSKYGKDDSLYPKDLRKRAFVDQRLHFETGVFATFKNIVGSILRGVITALEPSHVAALEEVYGFLEAFLEGKPWVAGDSVTVADFSIFSSTSTVNGIVPVDKQKFPRLCQWLAKVEALPAAEANKEGLTLITGLLKSKLK